eukprot:6412237-Amphidinium_carterae.1
MPSLVPWSWVVSQHRTTSIQLHTLSTQDAAAVQRGFVSCKSKGSPSLDAFAVQGRREMAASKSPRQGQGA